MLARLCLVICWFIRLHIVILGLLLASHACAQENATPVSVPTDDALSKATRTVADTYKKQYDIAKTAAQKHALAKKLLDDSAQTEDDLAAKYVMLSAARKLAVGIGDVDTALQAIDAQAERFRIDAPRERLDALRDLLPQAKTADDNFSLTRRLARELPALLQADDYKSAQTLAELALVAAKKAKDPDLVKQWTNKQEQFVAANKAWQAAAAAKQTLDDSPGDPAANGVVGKYLCLIKEDWEQGLPMLALSDDKTLQPLAERQLQAADTSAEQLAIADGWYDASASQSGLAKEATLRRAAKLYRQVKPSLTALPQLRLEKRLAEIDALTSAFPKDQWVEILDFVDLAKHQRSGEWRRAGLTLVAPPGRGCKSLLIPVVADGAYELRVQAVHVEGIDVLSVGLSQSANRAMFMLNCWEGFSGLDEINGRHAGENASKTPGVPIATHVPYTLTIQVEPKADQISVTSTFNGKPYTRWTGPIESLRWDHEQALNTFQVRICSSSIAVLSMQLKVKSGSAWLVE